MPSAVVPKGNLRQSYRDRSRRSAYGVGPEPAWGEESSVPRIQGPHHCLQYEYVPCPWENFHRDGAPGGFEVGEGTGQSKT